MTKKRVLLNISNHPTETWNEMQRWGWGIIDNVPFPHVGAELSTDEVRTMADAIVNAITERLRFYPSDTYEVAVYVAGEYTLSYMVVLDLVEIVRSHDNVHVVVPASDRIINKDGSREFVFLQWRELNI